MEPNDCPFPIGNGDTLRATCNGKATKVRLYCIDAPELSQKPWGQQSRDHLRAITPQRFRLIEHDRDRYGRTVAELIDPASGRNLNRQMVEQGQAAVYRRYCPQVSYRQAEQQAKWQSVGIWRQAGDWQRPWAYRHS